MIETILLVFVVLYFVEKFYSYWIDHSAMQQGLWWMNVIVLILNGLLLTLTALFFIKWTLNL